MAKKEAAKPAPQFDKESMRRRFWALKNAIDKAKEKIVPLREKRDAFVNKYNDRERDAELMKPILAIQADVLGGVSMFEAEQEMAMLARSLGNVGEPID
jgi:hypothetical protein